MSEETPRAPVRRVSGAVPVGERETTPAPPLSTERATPSTPAPAFDLASMAERIARGSERPVDPGVSAVAVLSRTAAAAPAHLDLRLAFLLLHVDGVTTMGEIARHVGLSLDEIHARFLELAVMGLVEPAT